MIAAILDRDRRSTDPEGTLRRAGAHATRHADGLWLGWTGAPPPRIGDGLVLVDGSPGAGGEGSPADPALSGCAGSPSAAASARGGGSQPARNLAAPGVWGGPPSSAALAALAAAARGVPPTIDTPTGLAWA